MLNSGPLAIVSQSCFTASDDVQGVGWDGRHRKEHLLIEF